MDTPNESRAAFLLRIFGVSFGEIAAASRHQISKTTAFRLATGRISGTSLQRQLFAEGLLAVLQTRRDSSYIFPENSPAVLATDPHKVSQ